MDLEPSIYDSVNKLTQNFISGIKENPEPGTFELDMDYDLLDKYYQNAPTAMIIYNHLTLGYNYISPNIEQIVGHTSVDFKKGGLKFAMSLVHPEDSKTYNSQIIPIMFKYLGIFMLKQQVKDLKFTFSFRLKNKNGEFAWMMHQMSILKSSFIGFPTLSQVSISEVSSIKKDDTLDFAVHKRASNSGYELLYKKICSSTDTPISFSGRELTVLKLLSQGKTSNEIAEDLNISFHTVNNHRKKMIERNKGKNTTELVQMAHLNGLL
jgi:DNA-binding CsgD family transcriptional regulator